MESLLLVSSCMKSKKINEINRQKLEDDLVNENICTERRRGHFIVSS